MSQGTPFIQMREVVKTFRTPAGDFTALKGINADFYQGDFVSIVGKSGSGKSTLVNMLTGIDRPTAGQVEVDGTLIHKLSESQMAGWRGRNLGIVFQFYQLLPMLSLLENTMLPMDFAEMYAPAERERRAMELLDMVGLADMADKMPAAVSGGQQQSAAIARALANDPPLIVADEPTGNLDSSAAARIFHLFESLARQNKTIIMVTHDNSLAQQALRTMLLVDGEVISQAVASTLPLLTHQQMLHATRHLHTQQFAPGETIIRQGEPNHAFYVITQGQTEVTIDSPEDEIPVAHLGPGQHFGEIELLHERVHAIANIKAAFHSAVEVVSLERSVFTHLMQECQAMRNHLYRIVQERLAQNAALLAQVGRYTPGSRRAQTSLA